MSRNTINAWWCLPIGKPFGEKYLCFDIKVRAINFRSQPDVDSGDETPPRKRHKDVSVRNYPMFGSGLSGKGVTRADDDDSDAGMPSASKREERRTSPADIDVVQKHTALVKAGDKKGKKVAAAGANSSVSFLVTKTSIENDIAARLATLPAGCIICQNQDCKDHEEDRRQRDCC